MVIVAVLIYILLVTAACRPQGCNRRLGLQFAIVKPSSQSKARRTSESQFAGEVSETYCRAESTARIEDPLQTSLNNRNCFCTAG